MLKFFLQHLSRCYICMPFICFKSSIAILCSAILTKIWFFNYYLCTDILPNDINANLAISFTQSHPASLWSIFIHAPSLGTIEPGAVLAKLPGYVNDLAKGCLDPQNACLTLQGTSTLCRFPYYYVFSQCFYIY